MFFYQISTLTDAGAVVNGTAGDDIFISTGVNLVGSVIDGGAGVDTLKVTASTDAGVVPGMLTSVEKIYTRQTHTNADLDLVNATGVTEVWSDRSTTATAISNIQSNVKVGMLNTASTLTTSFATPVTEGKSDVLNVVVDHVRTTAALTTGGGFETINLASLGADNTLANLTDASTKTLNISGDKALTLTTTGLHKDLTVNAADMTAGGVDIAIGTGGGTVKFTGSKFDDRVAFAGSDFTLADKVDGGEGVNTLAIGVAADLANVKASNVSNIQTIEFTGNVTAVDWTNVKIEGVDSMVFGGTGALAISGHKSAYTYELAEDATSFEVKTLGEADSLYNTLNITLTDSDVNGIDGSKADSSIEIMNITSSRAANGTLDGDANTLGIVKVTTSGQINLHGDADTTLTLGVASTLDASAKDFTGAITVIGSDGNDNIVGGSGGNTITGGKGGDHINLTASTAVKDVLTLAAGNSGAVTTTTIDAGSWDVITGFTAGADGDVLKGFDGYVKLSATVLTDAAAANDLYAATNIALAGATDGSWTAFAWGDKTYAVYDTNDAFDATNGVIVELTGVKVADLVDANFANV